MTNLPLHGPMHVDRFLNSTSPFFHSPLLPSSLSHSLFRSSLFRLFSMLSSIRNLQSPPMGTGFPNEPLVVFNSHLSQELVYSNSGSFNKNPPPGTVSDERKRRQMISNRESARRSRMRKQKHLDNMRKQVNRLRMVNRELLKRVVLVGNLDRLIRGENERLRFEMVVLGQRLWDIQILLECQQYGNSSAWACNNYVN